MKSLLSAAVKGKINIPGYAPTTTLDASETRNALAVLKEKTMKRVDEIYSDAIKFAENEYPDDHARQHYKTLREKLADFPQSASGWNQQRANMEKEIDEMARLASKRDDHHDHHDEHHISPAQEFETKYGMNLDELQETFNRFKSNPDAFLENSIIAKFGKNGLDVWKKSQEFSVQYNSLSSAEREKVEAEFTNFLKKA